MMREAVARKMDESRGYRDINPENILADWSRLRTQVTGGGYLPKLILCLPGKDDFGAKCASILQKAGLEYEFRERDPRMAKAFAASRCSVRRSLSDEDVEAIAQHTTVLYVLSDNFTFVEAAATSRAFLKLGCELLDAGALGVKCEASGIAHSPSFWRKLAGDAAKSGDIKTRPNLDFWWAAYVGYVQLPIQSNTDFYSCGMHVLGQPDMIVSLSLISEGIVDKNLAAYEAVELFDGFGLYLLAECDERGFTSGHTFRLNADSKRYRVLWEQCTGYDKDEFFYNPYGRWRFVNP